jgi:hypothetical protein
VRDLGHVKARSSARCGRRPRSSSASSNPAIGNDTDFARLFVDLLEILAREDDVL